MATYFSGVRVSVSNFGPVRRAELVAGDLTAVIGPNNVGKSWLASLIYAVHNLVFFHLPNFVKGALSEVGVRLCAGAGAECLRENLHEVEKVALERSKALAGEALKRELESVLGTSDFVTYGEEEAAVEASAPSLEVSFKALLPRGERPRVEVNIPSSLVKRAVEDVEWVAFSARGATLGFKGLLPMRRSVYIPAERIALLTAFYGVVEALVRLYGVSQLVREELPRQFFKPSLSLYAADVINLIRSGAVERVGGHFGDIGAALLDGDVAVEGGTMAVVYEHASGLRLPAALASSGVAQVAGLLLGLMVRRGDLAVVEEPEINLHANRQVQVAELLAREARRRPLFVTTHSDLVVMKLAHLYAKGEVESLRLYYLHDGELEDLPVDRSGGVPEIKSISSVIEELSGEALELYAKLQRGVR
ncbi:AAA family ATPase [Pyrobaculum neutrophilum]|uniref:ATPase AAA-type core domain-containing protein n=1 Tax=Pyrobaculum neutrophilum (strain DSM 2338 / JCM 9278 / NBRC 100436 / V24Sta) TaxID=444157 RepID=B1YE36_PYRNV|nr:AAA family ATPase [Pyrobaculum neutrophilum]ACB40049.1 conserved hypothetical protein [Pyrobaculum neutrophilum V24Sta]